MLTLLTFVGSTLSKFFTTSRIRSVTWPLSRYVPSAKPRSNVRHAALPTVCCVRLLPMRTFASTADRRPERDLASAIADRSAMCMAGNAGINCSVRRLESGMHVASCSARLGALSMA